MTLSEYMQAEGLTLTGLAERLGRPIGTVHNWLNCDGPNGRKPDIAVLAEIERRTGGKVTPADLRPELAALFHPARPSHASQDASAGRGVQAP